MTIEYKVATYMFTCKKCNWVWIRDNKPKEVICNSCGNKEKPIKDDTINYTVHVPTMSGKPIKTNCNSELEVFKIIINKDTYSVRSPTGKDTSIFNK